MDAAPPRDDDAPQPSSSPRRRFVLGVAGIMVVGFGLRLLYVAIVDPPLGFDAIWYQLQAGTIAHGPGYVDPAGFYASGAALPTANFPPLWPMVLGVVTWLGFDGGHGLQVTGALVGTATIGLTGVLARRVVGDGAALVAAGVVALSPALIASDGSLMSDSLYVLLLTAAVLVGYLAIERPNWISFLLLGVLLGAAALTRSDALIVAPILVGVVAWRVREDAGQRVAAAAIALVAVVAMLLPWAAWSTDRMGGTVLVSSNSGSLLEGANCPGAYSGELIGGWDERCLVETRREGAGELEWSADARQAGISFARDNARRLPLVASVRVLREWGLWPSTSQLDLEAVESRSRSWQALAWAYGLVVTGFAVPGAVVLHRRRAELAPLLAVVAGVTAVALVSWGNTRFRLAADPAVAILAAAAVSALWQRLRPGGQAPRQPGSVPSTETNDTISPG